MIRQSPHSAPARAPVTMAVAALGSVTKLVSLALMLALAESALTPTVGAARTDAPGTLGGLGTGGVEIVGQAGGVSRVVAVDAFEPTRVYLGVGPRVVAFDASGSGDPVRLGQSSILLSVVEDMVAGHHVVYAASAQTLDVIDMRNPTAPTITASFPTVGVGDIPWLLDWGFGFWSSDSQQSLALGGDLLLQVTDPYASIAVLDVADRFHPRIVGEIDVLALGCPGCAASDMAISGSLAYLALHGSEHGPIAGGFAVFDLVDPSRPALLRFMQLPAAAGQVAVVGTHALVADQECLLRVLDIVDPSAPRSVGCTARGFGPSVRRAAALADTAFVVDDSRNLWTVDWSDPTSPRLTGIADAVRASDIAVTPDGRRWYVAEPKAGLSVVAVDRLARVRNLGVAPAPRHPTYAGDYGLTLLGGVAAVGMYEQLHLFDVASANAPREVFSFTLPAGLPTDPVALDDRHLIVPTDDQLVTYDLTDPADPAEVSRHALAGLPAGLAASGSRVIAGGAMESGGFVEVVDYSTPGSPRRIAALRGVEDSLPWTVAFVCVEGERVYIVGRRAKDWVKVFDLADPSAPVELGAFPIPRTAASDVVVRDGHMYVAGSGGLVIVDARDPTAEREVAFKARIGGLTHPTRLDLLGDRLYVAGSSITAEHLWMLDVTDPAAPRTAGVVTYRDRIFAIAARRDRVYSIVSDRSDQTGSARYEIQVSQVVQDSSARRTGGARTVSYGEDVVAIGVRAYLTTWPGGLEIIDVSEAATPRSLGTYALPRGARDVATDGRLAYVVTPSRYDRARYETGSTIEIVDVSDPARSWAMGSLHLDDIVLAVALSGGRLYAAGFDGMTVFDVTADPAHPRPLGHLPTRAQLEGRRGAITSVVVHGTVAYVVDAVGHDPQRDDDGEPDEIRTVDVSDPGAPRLLGRLSVGDRGPGVGAHAIAVADGLIYAAVGFLGTDALYVIDARVPDRLTLRSSWLSEGSPAFRSVTVAGDHVFLASWFGVSVFALAADGRARLVAQVVTPGTSLYGTVAATQDGTVIMSDGNAGYVTIRLDPDRLPTPTAGPSPTPRPLPTLRPSPTPSPSPTLSPTAEGTPPPGGPRIYLPAARRGGSYDSPGIGRSAQSGIPVPGRILCPVWVQDGGPCLRPPPAAPTVVAQIDRMRRGSARTPQGGTLGSRDDADPDANSARSGVRSDSGTDDGAAGAAVGP